MPPKGHGPQLMLPARKLPLPGQPAEFSISQLRASKKKWIGGASGPQVAFFDSVCNVRTFRYLKDQILVMKAFFSEERLTFEIHEVEYSPAAVSKLLKREKELQGARLGRGNGSPPSSSFRTDDAPEEAEDLGSVTLDMFEAFKAFDLAPKHSIQVKFQDIVCIEASADTATLTLSQSPRCCVKPAGEPRMGTMEEVADITDGARSIVFKSARCIEICRVLTQQSAYLNSIFTFKCPASLPLPVKESSTPTRKRKKQASDESGRNASKHLRRTSSFFLAAAGTSPRIKGEAATPPLPPGKRTDAMSPPEIKTDVGTPPDPNARAGGA